MKGLFITFEGIEGCGKSTQSKQLAKHLKSKDFDVVLTRECGGTNIGAKIRKVLLDPENMKMDNKAEALLYAADRAQHVAEVIKPSLEAGKIVISDRYIDSSIAYQSFARGLPLEMVLGINEHAIQDIKPQLTFYLAVSVSVGLARALSLSSADRIEMEAIEFHEKVKDGFEEMAAWEPQRWRKIDGEGSAEMIHAKIACIVDGYLKVNEAIGSRGES